MIGEASTPAIQRTTLVHAVRLLGVHKEFRHVRGRVLLIVLVVLLLALVGGLGYLGLNPPNPVSKPVEKVLPNDKFQAH